MDACDVTASVHVVEPEVLCVHQPAHSPFPVIESMFERGLSLCETWKRIFAIITIQNTALLESETQNLVRENMKRFHGRPVHLAFVSEDASLMNVAFKFAMAVNPHWNYSFHKDFCHALVRVKEIRRAIGKTGANLRLV